MITPKEAAIKAAEFLREISFAEPEGLRVEEVRFSDTDDRWLITLGFLGDELPDEQKTETNPSSPLLFGPSERTTSYFHKKREYKLFRVNPDDGQVEDMAIRAIQ